MSTHYETFLNVVDSVFNGTVFIYDKKSIELHPKIVSAYDLVRDIKTPITEYEKYIAHLPRDFKNNARTELYRSERGWIERGVEEGRIVKYLENAQIKIVPKLDTEITVGIDSSRNLFAVCCFDNYRCGIKYIEKFLKIRKYFRTNEYHWSSLDQASRTYVISKLSTLLNISCKALFAINSSLINSRNSLSSNQFTGLIEGCFTGYESHPIQNDVFRTALRSSFFRLCDNNHIHCDPDFGRLRPQDIVKFLVRNLSRVNGRIQACTPSHALLKSHESEPIQIADLITGALSVQIRHGQIPPIPTRHLFFNDKRISRKDRRNRHWAKAYYWARNGG